MQCKETTDKHRPHPSQPVHGDLRILDMDMYVTSPE